MHTHTHTLTCERTCANGHTRTHSHTQPKFSSKSTHPLRTPRTKFNMKNEPRMMSGIKYKTLKLLPKASFVWNIKTASVNVQTGKTSVAHMHLRIGIWKKRHFYNYVTLHNEILINAFYGHHFFYQLHTNYHFNYLLSLKISNSKGTGETTELINQFSWFIVWVNWQKKRSCRFCNEEQSSTHSDILFTERVG